MIKIPGKMSGHYKLSKVKADSYGEPVEGTRVQLAEFDNLITNQGLDFIGDNDWRVAVQHCHVGSGSSTPQFTDVGLDSPIASVASLAADVGSEISASPYYMYAVYNRSFPAGAAEGNLSEIGMGWSSDNISLFSRALIEDSGGNPTTITILSDEILEVTYELRVYISESISNGTVELDGVMYDYIAKAANVANPSSNNGWESPYAIKANDVPANTNGQRVYDGEIDSTILGVPAGNSLEASSHDGQPYSAGDLIASAVLNWNINSGNLANGIRCMTAKVGWSYWQIRFGAQGTDDPINKDNTQTLSFTVYHTWDRA